MVYPDYGENLAKVMLPKVAEIFELYADRIQPSEPFTIAIHTDAKHYENFEFRIERSQEKYLLTFLARFPDSGYCVSNYVFEAGRTLPDILAWLRGPDCPGEVLRAMAEFDERIGRGV